MAKAEKTSGALAAGELSLYLALMIHGSGPNPSDDRRIGVVIRYISPHVKKPNNADNYGIPLLGQCDAGNFNLCAAPKGLFHSDNIIQYEQIREDQAKVMMAGARGNTAMYS